MAVINVTLPDEVFDRLRLEAIESDLTIESLIVEILAARDGIVIRRPRSLGLGCSGYADTSQLAGEIGFVAPPFRTSPVTPSDDNTSTGEQGRGLNIQGISDG